MNPIQLIVRAVVTGCLLTSGSGVALAQAPMTLPLTAQHVTLVDVSTGRTVATGSFQLDVSSVATVLVIGEGATRAVIRTPAGGRLPPSVSSPSAGSRNKPGGDITSKHQFVLLNPIPGRYVVEVTSSTRETVRPALIVVESDSRLGSAVVLESETIALGQAAAGLVALFDGRAPIHDARVTARIRSPAGSISEHTLRDDGAARDMVSGDGRYSLEFTPKEVGEHGIVIVARGRSRAGVPFERTSSSSLQVRRPSAKFGDAPSLRTVDDGNASGDMLELAAFVSGPDSGAFKAGPYRVVFELADASLRPVLVPMNQYLSAPGVVTATIHADRVRGGGLVRATLIEFVDAEPAIVDVVEAR